MSNSTISQLPPATTADPAATVPADNPTGTQTQKVTLGQIAALAGTVAPVQSVAGKTGIVTLTKDDVGLNQVDNIPDVAKQLSIPQSQAIDALRAQVPYSFHLFNNVVMQTNSVASPDTFLFSPVARWTPTRIIFFITQQQTTIGASTLTGPSFAIWDTTTNRDISGTYTLPSTIWESGRVYALSLTSTVNYFGAAGCSVALRVTAAGTRFANYSVNIALTGVYF